MSNSGETYNSAAKQEGGRSMEEEIAARMEMVAKARAKHEEMKWLHDAKYSRPPAGELAEISAVLLRRTGSREEKIARRKEMMDKLGKYWKRDEERHLQQGTRLKLRELELDD